MGFETSSISHYKASLYDLNFVPMGFETPWMYHIHSYLVLFELCPYGIWNIEEVKEEEIEEVLFELCPYGIWNNHHYLLIFLVIHLNFVPMGFETNKDTKIRPTEVSFELCPYGIWNFGGIIAFIQLLIFELCPYGIWNK